MKTFTIDGKKYTCPPDYQPATPKTREEETLTNAITAGKVFALVVCPDGDGFEVLGGYHGLRVAHDLDPKFKKYKPQVFVVNARTRDEKLAVARGMAPRGDKIKTQKQTRQKVMETLRANRRAKRRVPFSKVAEELTAQGYKVSPVTVWRHSKELEALFQEQELKRSDQRTFPE